MSAADASASAACPEGVTMKQTASRRRVVAVALLLTTSVLALASAAERARPPLPKITKPLTFDTPEADTVLAALWSSRPTTGGTATYRPFRSTRTPRR